MQVRSCPVKLADDPRDDHQLVAAINRGDGGAFESMYYRHRDWVVRLARRFTGHDEDALDVLQETFAYLHRKFPGFELTARLTTFLYPVVKNLSIAARRRRGRFALDELSLAETAEAPQADPSELTAIVAGLPEIQREVLLMRFVDDMSLEEIAVALSVPLGTVKSRLHNAIAALRADPKTRSRLE